MISRFFITRPIFACVISAFIVIAGLAGIRALPISAYPNIIPPQVEGMLYMNSINSGDGMLSITVTFEVGADPDLAAINVNNRVQAAVPASSRCRNMWTSATR